MSTLSFKVPNQLIETILSDSILEILCTISYASAENEQSWVIINCNHCDDKAVEKRLQDLLIKFGST